MKDLVAVYVGWCAEFFLLTWKVFAMWRHSMFRQPNT
jgi:hypothetical protein